MKLTGEWIAGFADGEGSLNIAGHGGSLQPRFRLNQRDDDGDLVRRIRRYLGVGSLHAKIYPADSNGKPQLVLNVVGKDCTRLVALFDDCPLRSKKRFEYKFWRKAVLIYARMQGQRWSAPHVVKRRTELLTPLRAKLIAVRKYRGPR